MWQIITYDKSKPVTHHLGTDQGALLFIEGITQDRIAELRLEWVPDEEGWL